MSLRPRNPAFLQDFVKEFPVLCRVYIFCGSSEDLNSHFDQCFCQLDRCLPAELNDCSVRFLDIHDVLHVFRCQRLKIQLVGDVKVRTHGFRVVVDDDRLVSLFCKCPGAVYGAEIKFNTLSDSDRPRSQYEDFLLSFRTDSLIFTAVHRIIIRRSRREFSRTRVNHLKDRHNIICFSHRLDVIRRFPVSFAIT